MQYILTEDEYKNLVPRHKYNDALDESQKLRELVLKFSKFKCIHERNRSNDDDYYCDNCPLAEMSCGRCKDFSQ
jgi:hypothetical protein